MSADTGSMLTENNNVSNLQFLTAIFGEYAPAAHVTGFAESPADLPKLGLNHYWGGGAWYKRPLEDPSFNNFFVIATFHQEPDGTHRRRKGSFAAGFCMMIDDVGTGPGSKIDPFLLGSLMHNCLPSWELETSPDNWQYGYIFDTPVMDRGKVEALLKGFVALGFVDGGADPGMLGVTRYARLPVGSNTKAIYGGNFQHKLTKWNPEIRYNIDVMADDFGIKLQDYYPEEGDYGVAGHIADDLVYQSLLRLGMIKGINRPGIYDIICPWVSGHTEELDNGSAYLAPMGFRCHHGTCESRKGGDLMGYLHGKDPVYAAHCASLMPFQPVSNPTVPLSGDKPVAVTTGPPSPIPALTLDFDLEFDSMLMVLDPNNPLTANLIYRLVAANYSKLDPLQLSLYLKLIKGKLDCTLKVARDQLSHVRGEILREHRKDGILDEPAWKDLEGDKILSTLDNYRALCEYHGFTLRFNQMNHTIDCDIPNQNFSPEDIDNLNLTHMRDMVHRYGMNFTRVGEWMNSIAFENEFHPFRDYLDKVKLLPFDPMCPMFAKLMTTLTIDEFEQESEVFVRRWLISIVAAVRGHAGAGMKGVLTFSGPQGIGKTSWFRNLFADGYFQEGVVLDPGNKDTILLATNALVTEFGELDSTFKRDIPALKAFISNQFDKVRHPYAAKVSNSPRRTVFCATVNQSDFLVDQTGNSRFWPIAISNCDFLAIEAMRKSGELDLLWREIDAMYDAAIDGVADFRWWIGVSDGDMLNEVSEGFVKESVGEGMLREAFDMDAPRVDTLTTTEIMFSCGLSVADHTYGARKGEVLQAIKRITGQHRSFSVRRGGRVTRGFKMPPKIGAASKAKLTVVALPFEPEMFPWL